MTGVSHRLEPPAKQPAAVLTANGCITAANYQITLAHAWHSLYFTMADHNGPQIDHNGVVCMFICIVFIGTKLYCLVAIALPLEGSGPHLLHGSLGSLEYKLQTAFWLIQSFSTAELCPTDNSKPVVTYANSTSLQTHNHTKTSLLNFYRPDALPDARPTVSKHWRYRIIKIRQTSRDTWWPWNVSRNSALYFAAATGS